MAKYIIKLTKEEVLIIVSKASARMYGTPVRMCKASVRMYKTCAGIYSVPMRMQGICKLRNYLKMRWRLGG